MSDAAGTVTYSYDQLSRLTTEARQINALSNSSTGGSYPVTYEYNFADSVKKVIDPFGARIDYSRDTASRLIGVSGSAFAGVTQYVTNVQYRAWGAVKAASYTDNTATIQYNSRLLPSAYQLSYNGFVGNRENYSYFADGRISGLTDLNDTNGPSPPWTMRYLSRLYTYDQVGRVIDNSGPNGLPLRQSYGYDSFGNMTVRWGTYFFQASQFQTAAYVNNRRTDWSYNAEGQITNVPASATDPANTFTYDAAGRQGTRVQTTGTVVTTFSQGYDGDGELISAVTAPSGSSSTVGYDIRSSVLGTVLTELDQSGNKRSTHVSADGLLFASQNINSAGASVSSTIRNPVGTGERTGAIYDPLGNYIPFQHYNDPRPPAGSYNSGSMSSLTANQANPDSYGVGCRIDGVPTSCNRVLQAINSGQAKTLVLYGATVDVALANMGWFLVEHPVPAQQTKPPHMKFGRSHNPSPGNHDPYPSSSEVEWRYSLIAFMQPQKSTIDIIPTDLKARVMDIVGNCSEVMRNFLKALGKHVYSPDLERTFDRMTSITIDAEPFKAPFVPKGADGLSGDRKIFILPAESVAKLAPEFRWNKIAKVVVQELLHQSRDHGLFSDQDLDRAGLALLSGQDLIDAKNQMKANDYEPGTVGHGVIGRNCYPTNPYGPPP
jgi:hypothetical protein